MWNALTVSTLLLATSSVAAPSEWLVRRADDLVGCYSSSLGMSNKTSNEFQSSGWCQDRCMGDGAAAFALTGGSYCLCGNELPPSSDKVDSSNCNTPCPGWPKDKCGADDYYSVYTTGLESNVESYSASTTSSSSSNSTASETSNAGGSATTNSAGQTVYVTDTSNNDAAAAASAQAAKQQDEEKQNKSHNTAAIAAGVVVGVVGVAAMAGAAFFLYRSRKQKAQGYRGGRDSGLPSMSDSRFDGQYMAQRRQSNGSIDDDQDFSRRILQVTNPDR
ncbi:uncharacterized protein N7484_011324 [Penicillium longicatenatum]|uniref:uncharacterized protein n=1 Tax=Penicillium longicatenatum TaxID=1561947 RepID=UPI002548A5D8|nr:uncharacterized protein N7484_011324 [Penicillium longicatenatum]KAJ5631224.1 hypothetical protein N7484_011324 [Penicillium longicatenatum]KAJ5659589.1 hypothetical protein N7507_006040 [Penicillium longicatenatum]